MITQTNFQGPDSDRSSDMKNEMSPQTSLHPASFDEEDFDIPQVNLTTISGEVERVKQRFKDVEFLGICPEHLSELS